MPTSYLHNFSTIFFENVEICEYDALEEFHALHRQLWERKRKCKFAAAQLEEEAGEAADLRFHSSSKFGIRIVLKSDSFDNAHY